MRENAAQISEDLIEQHGIAGAQRLARDRIITALAAGDNYRHSIWREVRTILSAKHFAAASTE
jgi:hypothetical protein